MLALALADINHIGPPPSSRLLPSEKPTRACRASLKAAGLAQSMVQSAAAAAEAAVSAVNASLSTAPFASAVREESAVSTDSANTKRSVIYTASQVVGSKRDSFVIGASVPLPHAEMLLSRSRTATATDADLDDTNTAESGILNTAEEHTHIFVSENIDPAEFDDTDLQLHYDEDKWDNVSDSSDADVLLPSEPGPPPVNDEGVINLTDDMLFNLRRYDELDLGIARVNPIALHAKMKLQAKPKVKAEIPAQNAEAGTDKTDQLPLISGAAENAADADLGEGSTVLMNNADPVPGSPFSPRRPSIQSPGRSSTAHSLRKSLKSGNSERAASRGESQHARLHSAVSAAAEGTNGLELTTKASTERGHSRGGEVPVRMDRLAPDVEVVRISTAQPGAKPLTPHTNKKGVVKLNFTRDMAQGGLPGKQLGEPKGTVSFSVPANAAIENRFHELDLNEGGSLTSDFDFSQTCAPESARENARVSPRKASFSERTGSGKASYPVVMVPTAPLPSDSPDPDCTPKPVGNGRGASFFPDSSEAVLLHSAEDAANENFGQADGLHLKTNLEEGEVVDTDAALSPFSIQLNVPVQGIDPLNNSMSPLFALYAGGAALYSERVTEMIEEQQRAKTAERLGTAAESRPVTTHGSRLTTPALNTHTRATERGRPQTPPQVGESRLEGSALTENSRSKKMASMTLPFVRLAPTENTRTHSHTSSSIMFDDSLADESVNAHFSGMSLLKLAPQRFDQSQVGAGHSHLSLSSHTRAADASIPDTRTPLEKQQAQFLHEMGLEYKQIFGEHGVLSPQKKRQLSKQSPRPVLEGKNAATYNTGFPLRRAMYERDAVQLRGNADETMPVLVHEKHKGVGRIRPVEKERVFLRHQLDQYYQHIESSLREQQLVEEAQTEITAKRIFDLVHQVSLLDAEEQSRLLLQETIQRRWLARGGNWKGKHKYRNNHSHTSTQTDASVPQETPESRQLAYRKLRMKLKSHGSAEGSILQGYNDLIMGSEEDPGNGWQWLTGQEGSRDVLDNKDTDNNVIIPTASVGEYDVDRLGSAETGCGSQESREVTPSSEVPERLAYNPLLPSDSATIEQDGAVAASATKMVNKKQVASSKKKEPREVSARGKPFQQNGSPVLSAGSTSEHNNAHAHVHFPLQDHSQPLVQYAMDQNTSGEQQVRQKPPRHLSLNPHSPARSLVSPPQVRISLFPSRADENKRSTSPTARGTNQQMVLAPTQDPRVGITNNSGRKDRSVRSPKRQLAVTLRSAPVDHRLHSAAPASAPALTDFLAQSLRSSPHTVPNEEHFPEAQPHTDELQPLPGIQSSTSTSSQQAAELMRMDSEYANYLRYGDIYTQSILAGVDTEQLSLHGSGLVLPSANTLRDSDNTANTVKFNPLLSKRLYAVASTQPNRTPKGDNFVNITSDTIESFISSTELHGGAHLEEPTVEILARDLKQAIHTRQVELETTAPRVFIHPDKVLSPRRPATERPSPMAKTKVTFVAPPVQDEGYPVTPRLAITAARPEGAVLKVISPGGLHKKSQRGFVKD